MPVYIEPEDFYRELEGIPLIDVRSPSEYSRGHIPGALNIPLFDDSERKAVGITYHKKGREESVKLGLRFAGPKLELFVNKAEKIAADRKMVLYCWRGGMRSESMAWLFEKAGFDCYVISGGYKSYRKYIRNAFKNGPPLIILGGYTGAGKTRVLSKIRNIGGQVLDLEQIANHKGSAFGALGMKSQPTGEQFENLIAGQWLNFDQDEFLWIENESLSIGSVNIPETLFFKMKESPVIILDIPKERRIQNIVKEYARFSASGLKNAIDKIDRRLGLKEASEAKKAIDSKDFRSAVELVLRYYDKAYKKSLNKKNPKDVIIFSPKEDNPEKIAWQLVVSELKYLKNESHISRL